MNRYNAKYLPKNKGPAAWNILLGEQEKPRILQENSVTDYLIIGGGFAGLSAAKRLLELDSKSRIMVVEAGRIAEGATGRNSGFMIDLPHDLSSDNYAGKNVSDDKTIIKLNREAILFAKKNVEEYHINPHFFDHCGKINGAASEKGHHHNVAYQEHLSQLNEDSTMLDEKQMYEITGSRHYVSGLFTKGTAVIQPAGYIRGLVAGLKKHIDIYEHSPVLHFSRLKNSWHVMTPKAYVNAKKIIITTNGHLESFGIAKGKLLQIFLYASMTEELDNDALKKLGGHARWGVTPSDPMGTTMRRIDHHQGGNRVITRTCASLSANMQASNYVFSRASRVHYQKFTDRFPQLKGIKMQYQWAGHLCLTLNNVSVVQKIDEDVYAACAQNGLGTVRGTLSGIAAAELACHTTSHITEYFSNAPKAKNLPIQPFRHIGGNTALRWKEWRAGNE